MKKLAACMVLLVSVVVFPAPSGAQVNLNIGISLPPPVQFASPPHVIVLPETDDVYVIPDIDVDLYFWSGWWWRLWEGRWYRSHHYARGWKYYSAVPRFYFDVDSDWRHYYRDHLWRGFRWNYEIIPDSRLRLNWKHWHNSGHWEKQGTWGVQQYRPRSQKQKEDLRHQREEHYLQRPDVRKHMPEKKKEFRKEQERGRSGREGSREKPGKDDRGHGR